MLYVNIYFILICAYLYPPRGEEKTNCVSVQTVIAPPYLPWVQASAVKTEIISFGSVLPGGVKLEISTKEVPVVHTETKTITYESSQVRASVKPTAPALCLPL